MCISPPGTFTQVFDEGNVDSCLLCVQGTIEVLMFPRFLTKAHKLDVIKILTEDGDVETRYENNCKNPNVVGSVRR